MTLKELKDFIESGTKPSDFMIFIRKDSNFLAKQYIKALSKLFDGGMNEIKSIYDPQQSSLMLLTSINESLNVLFVETFDERSEDYTQFENTIVVCDQVDKSIAKSVENFIIKFPKLEEWQIFDYAKKLCPAIDDEDLMWIVKASNSNILQFRNLVLALQVWF